MDCHCFINQILFTHNIIVDTYYIYIHVTMQRCKHPSFIIKELHIDVYDMPECTNSPNPILYQNNFIACYFLFNIVRILCNKPELNVIYLIH